MTGEKTVPELPLAMSPLPLMAAVAVVPLEVEGPALKKPPAIELAITTALPLSKLPPLRLGKVVPTTVMVAEIGEGAGRSGGGAGIGAGIAHAGIVGAGRDRARDEDAARLVAHRAQAGRSGR